MKHLFIDRISGRRIYCKSVGQRKFKKGISPCHGQHPSSHCTCFQWTLHAWPSVWDLFLFLIFLSSPEIQSRYPVAVCIQVKPQFGFTWGFQKKKKEKRTTFFWEALNLFVSYNISPDPVIKLYDSDPKDLFLIKISALMQLLSLDTVVLTYDFT